MAHTLSVVATLARELAESSTPQQTMQTVVTRLRSLFDAAVCSLYLLSPDDDRLDLVATEGLSPEAIGQVSLRMNEGIIGLVARSMRTVNVADAACHESYIYIPQTHEEPFHQFLAAPLIYHRQLIGVLAVQGPQSEVYDSDAEALLVTISAQLASSLHPLQQKGQWQNSNRKRYQRYSGIRAASGIGVGRLLPIGLAYSLDEQKEEYTDDPDKQTERFEQACAALDEELSDASERLERQGNSEISSLLGIYQMMLQSPELKQGVLDLIQQRQTACWALRNTVASLAAVFEAASDPYLNARQEDIRNIGNRLLQHLKRKNPIEQIQPSEDLVLAGRQISITDLATLPIERIRALVCTEGSALSHTAIVAKALGITAVMGVEGLDLNAHEDQIVLVDGYRGDVICQPDQTLQKAYLKLQAAEQQLNTELEQLRDQPAVTPDNVRIKLLANTGLLADVSPGLACGAEGIGLYRSEMPFMQHHNFPTEDEQYQTYLQVLSAYQPRPVYMRILDIGGDKQLPYFEIQEDNPYLGWRGIRLMLDNTSLLITQLRAMLRASEGLDNLCVLAPMVARVEELALFRDIVKRVHSELDSEGYSLAMPKIGMMLEVPSVLFMLPQLAPLLDFISIGSNDLTQYLLAVDRTNTRVAELFDHLDPSVLRALQQVQQQCQPLGVELSLCGEMASDPAAALLLVGLGFKQLSLAAHQIPKIKWLIQSVSQQQAAELVEECLQMKSAQEIRARTDQALVDLGLGRLAKVAVDAD